MKRIDGTKCASTGPFSLLSSAVQESQIGLFILCYQDYSDRCGTIRPGPKTVFFWAPVMKWSLVLAGIADFARPADKLSPAQVRSMVLKGAVWARYSFVIIPVNYTLASVNIFSDVCRLDTTLPNR
ncbi:hypothetical protein COOONC_15911 [Cooperia oncophora]